jgi:hypothetical protein
MEDQMVMRDILIVLQAAFLVLAAYKLLVASRSLRAVREGNATLAASRGSRDIRAQIIFILAMSVLIGSELVSANVVFLGIAWVVAAAGVVAAVAYRRER